MPATWADTHPRTLHLLGEEVDVWERGGPLQLALRR
jgi:exopolyphosphatase/guanosine-5'-triphosphate,3'-diphosphate pyrophosphatase